MKKFVAGFLIASLIFSVSTAFAAEVKTMIGRVIQGQFDITVDGQKLSNPVIVVDGTSFAPVREFGEAIGYNVLFTTEGGVVLEKKVNEMEEFDIEVDDVSEKIKRESAIYSALNEKKNRAFYLEESIASLEKQVEGAKQAFLSSKEAYEAAGITSYKDTPFYQFSVEELAKAQEELSQLEAEIADLEAEIQQQEEEGDTQVGLFPLPIVPIEDQIEMIDARIESAKGTLAMLLQLQKKAPESDLSKSIAETQAMIEELEQQKADLEARLN